MFTNAPTEVGVPVMASAASVCRLREESERDERDKTSIVDREINDYN
jgi:hypothetical protein